jgi:hypothetical protein
LGFVTQTIGFAFKKKKQRHLNVIEFWRADTGFFIRCTGQPQWKEILSWRSGGGQWAAQRWGRPPITRRKTKPSHLAPGAEGRWAPDDEPRPGGSRRSWWGSFTSARGRSGAQPAEGTPVRGGCEMGAGSIFY